MVQWRGRRQSSNIEDRRGSGGIGGFGRSRIPMGLPGGFGRSGGGLRGGGLGGIGIVIVGLVILWALGINPLSLLNGGTQQAVPQQQQSQQVGREGPLSDEGGQFVATILADTEDTWKQIFQDNGMTYREPTLVLFNGFTQSGCGNADAGTGPFYCPLDQKLYLDLSFFDELARRFGAPGDFAQAYVIAHEVGHHVQQLTGVLDQTTAERQRSGQAQSNAISVRVELQADCYAGVWGAHSNQRGMIESGDLQEALDAAQAIGDDTIQRRTQGTVIPESFNHGTSAQRMEWFRRGFESGDVNACDTFSGRV